MKVVAIVLGAAVWPGGTPSPALRRRAERAAALYRAGAVELIVASGGIGRHAPSEAEAIRDVVTALGVPEAAVLLEDRSRNTRENLRFSQVLLPDGAKVLIVSDGWHLPRARLIAHRMGLRAKGASAGLAGTRPLRLARHLGRETGALIWEILRPPAR